MSDRHAVIELRCTGALGAFAMDVAFSCPMRGVTALYGPSGCGKTTILRFIAGLQDMGGWLRVGGEVWQDEGQEFFLPPHRRPIGYVFQEPSLFPHLTVRGNLEFGLARIPKAERRVAFEEAVALLGVGDLLARRPDRLSGGQRQRVGIARALLASPRLLLMDEPLASLDHRSRREILPYLERLHAELSMPVVYVSHAPDEVARLADHLVLLDAGRVRAAGPMGDLHARLDIALDRGAEVDTIIEATVAGHDEAFHLSHLDFAGGRFCIGRSDLKTGRRIRLRVMANDVSIALRPQADTSILNVFPASVEALADDGPSQVLVRLDVAGSPLLARITRKSAHTLGLEPGRHVYAQVKAAALVE